MTEARLEGLTEMLERVKGDTLKRVQRTMQVVGVETVTYLRSLTKTMRPPVRPGEGPRRAHPGGWADVTGNLANAYEWEVDVDAGAGIVTLVLKNGMEYAAYLDARDGYFVLRGVADEGGPVEQALVRILARVAPGMQVVRG